MGSAERTRRVILLTPFEYIVYVVCAAAAGFLLALLVFWRSIFGG